MRRVTIALDDDLMADIDRFMARRGYRNRSGAIRDLARAGIAQSAEATIACSECVAAVVYLYEHEVRELPKRLARTYHARHDLSLATFHAHLDRDSCLEVTMLKGPSGEVRHFAEHVIAERGVHHGRLVLIPLPAGHGQHGAPPLALRRRAGRGG
jgi:CopG family nickel-responsive transcriptional regulator